jgi:type ISP restriction-modification system protein
VVFGPVDQHYMQGDAYCHPLRIAVQTGSIGGLANWTWNTPIPVLDALIQLWHLESNRNIARGPLGPTADTTSDDDSLRELAALLLFWSTISVLHADAYRHEHLRSLRYLWPRVPIASHFGMALQAAKLGRFIGDLYRSHSMRLPRPPTSLSQVFQEWGPETPWSGMGVNDAPASVEGTVVTLRNWSEEAGGTVSVELRRDDGENITINWRPVPEPVWKKVVGGRQVLRDLLERWRNGERFTSHSAHEYTAIIRRVAMLVRASEVASDFYQDMATAAATRGQLGLPEQIIFDTDDEADTETVEDNGA